MNCPVCGAELPQEALFCGECGSSVTAKPKTRPLVRDPRPSDTTVIDPLSSPEPSAPGPQDPVPPGPSAPQPPAPQPDVPQSPVPQAPVRQAPARQAPAPQRDAESAPRSVAASAPGSDPEPGTPRPRTTAPPAEESSPVGTPAATRAAEPAAPSFTLRFSTGERIRVSGTGLIGRRPIAQPGEQPDQLVSVADTGRSVSKTHLEFGIESGDLWISDRYSANGTSIIPPSGAARRCEPGRRYRVERGAAIEIGDQRIDVD